MTKVALTGATGFIGTALLTHLVEHGYQVNALYRPDSRHLPNHIDSVTWLPGSLEDLDSLRSLVTGVDTVIHCAGTVRGITLDQFSRTNAEGTERLIELAIEQNAARFILISSLAAREPALSAYAASKKLGEDVLQKYNKNISCDIVRPPAVYGPGDREMQPLLKMIRRGIIPVTGSKTNRFSLLYIDDLAKAVVQLLNSKTEQDQRCFELHDGHPDGYTWEQIAAIATRLNGKASYCFLIPHFVLQAAGVINLFLARLFGYQPMLTPGKVRELLHPDWSCDNTLITRATGWQPQVLFQDGMKHLFQ